MLFLYAHMGIVIWRSRQAQLHLTTKRAAGKNDILAKAQVNIFYTCLILLILYFTCWFWNNATMILYLAGIIPYSNTLYDISVAVIVFNSGVNPFIYTLRYDEFQQHLKIIVLRKKGKSGEHIQSNSAHAQTTDMSKSQM